MPGYADLHVSTKPGYVIANLAFAGCSRVHFQWAEGKVILLPKMFGRPCGQCYPLLGHAEA